MLFVRITTVCITYIRGALHIWGCCGLGAHCRGGLVAGTEVEVVVGGEGVGSVFSVCAAERTSAAGLLWVSRSGAHLGKTGVGAQCSEERSIFLRFCKTP